MAKVPVMLENRVETNQPTGLSPSGDPAIFNSNPGVSSNIISKDGSDVVARWNLSQFDQSMIIGQFRWIVVRILKNIRRLLLVTLSVLCARIKEICAGTFSTFNVAKRKMLTM